MLRVELLEAFALPLKSDCYIHVCLGQYFLLSKSYGKHKDGYLEIMDGLPDKKMQLAEDATMLPDLVIYFAKGPKEKDRISFVRIKSADVVSEIQSSEMTIYKFQTDHTLVDPIPGEDNYGYLNARINLFKSKPQEALPLRE